eukprot:40381-Pelagomonas_calceolata.AAC.1
MAYQRPYMVYGRQFRSRLRRRVGEREERPGNKEALLRRRENRPGGWKKVLSVGGSQWEALSFNARGRTRVTRVTRGWPTA